MPFTFAHPALLVPFHRHSSVWISWTALTIGTMVPDFEYFFRLKTVSTHSHTLWGLLYWDIPVGLTLFFIYNHWVKKVVFPNLPIGLQQRLFNFKNPINIGSIRQFIVVCFSIYIGAVTHIFWDAWTHPNGYFVAYFDALQKQIEFFSFSIPYYKIAQHGSTLIGCITLFVFLFRLSKNKLNPSSSIKNFWVLIFVSAMVTYLILLFSFPTLAMGSLIVRGISLIMLSIIVHSFIFHKSIK